MLSVQTQSLLWQNYVSVDCILCALQDMDYVWCQYERMESELAVFRSQLQHVCHYGMHQVQRPQVGYGSFNYGYHF